MKEIIKNSFDIFTTLAKDFMASHSLTRSSQILKAENPILTKQSSSKISYHINKWHFKDPVARDSVIINTWSSIHKISLVSRVT